MDGTSPQPGWYVDPENAAAERYWTGTSWGDRRPGSDMGQPPPPVGPPLEPSVAASPASSSTAWAIAIALVLSVVGLVVGYQPVSLLSGSGILYVGLAIAAGGVILAFVMRLRAWVRVVASIAVALVIANIVTVEHQLNERRQQIQNEFTNFGSPSP